MGCCIRVPTKQNRGSGRKQKRGTAEYNNHWAGCKKRLDSRDVGACGVSEVGPRQSG